MATSKSVATPGGVAYLPEWATLAEASRWLEDMTGEPWSLPRIIVAGVWTAVWLDYMPGLPAELFKDRQEGFLARMVFASDVARLKIARDGLLTMTRLPDDRLVKFTPGLRFELTDLRLRGEDLRRLCVKPMKRAELVKRHRPRWPSIEADLGDASRNGLGAAKAGRHGWYEFEALAWAKAKDKLGAPVTDIQSVVHKIGR